MNSYDLAEIWVRCKDKLKESFNEKVFNVWIKPIMPLEVTDTYYKVAVKNDFFKTMLEENYAQVIEGVLAGIMSKNIKLIIETMDNGSSGSEAAEEMPAVPAKREQQQLFNENTSVQQPDESNLNPKYVFETFVIGNSNRFAHAAAQAVANDPAHAYNPLFLYGGVGLGKTHLMHAIGNRIKQNNPSMKVLYTSSEKFTNEIINSIQNKTTEAFRQKYRNADLLLMDDIQFIAGKDSTQEEFFHTFNCLYEAGKQIVVTSDRPPKEMKRLNDRLCSRLEGGLLADVQPPDLETRTAIIRTKAAQFGMVLSEEVVQYIAENITSNVRQLEGVVKRLTAYRDILDDTITVDSVKRAIKDVIRTGTYIPTPDVIIEESARSFQLSGADLRGQSRSKKTAMARQIAMYLMRNLTNLPLKEIGEEFGGRNHATVLSSIRKVEELLKSDPDISATVRDITSNINSKN